MKRYHTQIIMVSGQMIPNVTPVLDEAIRPKKVILCASDSMRERAEALATFFKGKHIATEIFPLGYAYDYAELQEQFLELAVRFGRTDSVAVNLTGGTKLMTIAAQMVFDKRPCFYVIPQEDEIITLHERQPTHYAIQDKILLRDFFAVHGYTVTSMDRKKGCPEKTQQLANDLLFKYDIYKKQLGVLNALAARAEDAYSLTFRNELSNATCDLLDLFYQHGSISYYDDKKIEFASTEARDFCKGFWLEDFIAAELRKIDDKIGLQDYANSIQIESSSGTKNEIDAAFLYNNELYVIECKTARMNDKGSDVLYKIDTIRSYAGLYTKPIVATFKELSKYDRQRAKDLHIQLIEGRDLNRFAEHIIKTIRPNQGEKI